MTGPAEIRVEGLVKRFRPPGRPVAEALSGIDLRCPAGRLSCVLGPSGCGKTTLLRIVAGLDAPSAGQVLIGNGVPGAAGGPRLGMVSQEGDLLPWRTAEENAALGLELAGWSRRRRRARARAVLERLGLDRASHAARPHELSGGMRQRVALARAWCANADVLLLDEPFARLDEPTRHELQDLLIDLHAARPITTLLVTHSIEEAVYLAEHAVVMSFGAVVARREIDLPRPRDRLSDPFVQEMLAIRRALLSGRPRATADDGDGQP
jgi:NitT/TauT family transport system ATP-binding protein